LHTWNLPCDRLGILSISSILSQMLPQTSSQTQGNSRVSRMEHQTPSVFPGNFRKRKVLETICFPFCLPENLGQPNLRLLDTSLLEDNTEYKPIYPNILQYIRTVHCDILAYIPHFSCEPYCQYSPDALGTRRKTNPLERGLRAQLENRAFWVRAKAKDRLR